MYGDFHTLTISTPASFTYDADGRHSVVMVATAVSDARLSGGNAREVAEFAQRGISLDAVAHIPFDVSVPTESGWVDTTCEVACDDDELHPQSQSTFRIIEVHPLQDQVRLMLTRTQAR